MEVLEWINKEIEKRTLFFPFLDLGKENGEKFKEKAKLAGEIESDSIVVGGSLNINVESMDEIIKGIKDTVDLPILVFPGNTGMVSKYADAVFFSSLLNSRNPYWITGAQAMTAPIIYKYQLEVIPTGYVVVEPGGTSSWIGDANPIPKDKPQLLTAYASYSELSGKKIICVDTGVGKEVKVPVKLIDSIKDITNLPVIFNGKILHKQEALNLKESGGDIIITEISKENIDNLKEVVEVLK